MAQTPILERLRRNLGDMNGSVFTPAALQELLDEAAGDELEATRIGLWRKVTALSNFNQKASGYDADQSQRNHKAALDQYEAWIEYLDNRAAGYGGSNQMIMVPVTYAIGPPHNEYQRPDFPALLLPRTVLDPP